MSKEIKKILAAEDSFSLYCQNCGKTIGEVPFGGPSAAAYADNIRKDHEEKMVSGHHVVIFEFTKGGEGDER